MLKKQKVARCLLGYSLIAINLCVCEIAHSEVRMVPVEVFTSTPVGLCPAVNNEVHTLAQEYSNIIPLQFHLFDFWESFDFFEILRMSFYQIMYIPSVVVGGELNLENPAPPFDELRQGVMQHLSEPTHVRMQVGSLQETNQDDTFRVSARLTLLGSSPNSENLNVHLLGIYSPPDYNEFCISDVVRVMQTVSLNLMPGETQIVESSLLFPHEDLIAGLSNIKFVAIAQRTGKPNSKILQASRDVSPFEGLPDSPIIKGDANCDQLVNNFDLDPFVLAISDAGLYYSQYPECNILNSDVNEDGLVNNFDIDGFLVLLGGGELRGKDGGKESAISKKKFAF